MHDARRFGVSERGLWHLNRLHSRATQPRTRCGGGCARVFFVFENNEDRMVGRLLSIASFAQYPEMFFLAAQGVRTTTHLEKPQQISRQTLRK